MYDTLFDAPSLETSVVGSGVLSGGVVVMTGMLGSARVTWACGMLDGSVVVRGGLTWGAWLISGDCTWGSSIRGMAAFVGLAVLTGTFLLTRVESGPVLIRDLRAVRIGPVKSGVGVDET